MRLAFLYAGQGSQFVGMGKDIYEAMPSIRPYFDRYIGNVSLKQICFEGPQDQLFETRYNQIAMSAFALAVTDLLGQKNIRPVVAAGLSLGEYNALYAAGFAEADTIMNLLLVRGQAMQDACEKNPGSMVAVLGMPAGEIEAICAELSEELGEWIGIANYNTQGQYVVATSKKAMEQVVSRLREKGAKRVLPLAVAGAFHSPLMAPAVGTLEEALHKVLWKEPFCPVISNVTSAPIEATAIVDELTQQLFSPVRFEGSLNYLSDLELDGIIEIGPGKVLAGFVKKSPLKNLPIYSIQTIEDIKVVWDQYGG